MKIRGDNLSQRTFPYWHVAIFSKAFRVWSALTSVSYWGWVQITSVILDCQFDWVFKSHKLWNFTCWGNQNSLSFSSGTLLPQLELGWAPTKLKLSPNSSQARWMDYRIIVEWKHKKKKLNLKWNCHQAEASNISHHRVSVGKIFIILRGI